MRLPILTVCGLALWLALVPAHAQETGGSMGGADFSAADSGGGSGSGDSGDSGPSSYDSGSSSSSGGGSSSSGGDAGEFFVFICLFIGVILVVSLVKGRSTAAPAVPSTARGVPVPRNAGETMFLSSLVLGIDWHARSELQKTLAAIAARKLGGTAEGRATMLREVVLALARAELSWLYFGSGEPRSLSPAAAEAEFRGACHEARSRFRRELIRNEGGEIATQAAGPAAPSPEEGAGTVVVSLILVTRHPLRPLSAKAGAIDAAEIRAALSERSALTGRDLVAIEVVWSPAAEEDRMSTSELEQHYPELALIDPRSIAGRLFCSYCDGAFAMELLSCPHCGAAVDKGS